MAEPSSNRRRNLALAVGGLLVVGAVLGRRSLSGRATGGEGGCEGADYKPSSAAPSGVTSSALAPAVAVSIASGIFGIVNGTFTAYTTLDNISKFGAPTPSVEIVAQLKKANESLASLQASQNQQFLALKIDVVMGVLNDLDSKIGRAWGELESSADSGTPFVPSTLTWDDFDALTNRLASMNGTSDAFSLIRESMLATTGAIADDPLGSYALRMRTRMAQIPYLLTRSTPITQSQKQTYDVAVTRFENSFAKATRAYFITKLAPVAATGVTEPCYQLPFTNWAYKTPEGSNGGYITQVLCEDDRINWSALAIINARRAVVNTVWSQNDALSTGKWKRQAGTMAVEFASVSAATNDVTKALALMCNGAENCSMPAASVLPRLGTDSRLAVPANLDVAYRCLGEDVIRTATFKPGQDAVLTCNVRRAIAGVYVNTAHDANPGRLPEDTVYVEPVKTASYLPTDVRLASWTWKPGNVITPTFTMRNTVTSWDVLMSGLAEVAKAQWGEEGHPLRMQPTGQTSWFNWTGQAAELPVVP